MHHHQQQINTNHPPSSSKQQQQPPPPLEMKHNNNQQQQQQQQQVFPPLNYSRSYFTQWLLQSAAAAEVVAASTTSSSSSLDSPSSSPRRAVPLVLPPQLTNNHHHHHHTPFFNNDSLQQQQQPSRPLHPPPPVQNKSNSKTNRMELIQLLAINALEFTAPVYSFLNKDTMTNATTPTGAQPPKKDTPPPVPTPASSSTSSSSSAVKHHVTRTNSSNSLTLTHHSNSELKLEREIIQLSGHPGSFAPAGPNSIWKKMPTDSLNEADVYETLRDSPSESGFRSLAASYISRAEYKGQVFIELEDLVTRFSDSVDSVSIMDLKLGTRTFLESEVQNSKPRADLFDKLYKIDPSSLTEEELARGWITKLRYMTFREELSSTRSLGFRIEGLKQNNNSSEPQNQTTAKNFQKLRSESEIRSLLHSFCSRYKDEYVRKLVSARAVLESSAFFRSHEMIGSSLLLIHDNNSCGVWIIDFAKTIPLNNGAKELSHRAPWQLGNHEDGVLTGLDNIIRLLNNNNNNSEDCHS